MPRRRKEVATGAQSFQAINISGAVNISDAMQKARETGNGEAPESIQNSQNTLFK